MDLDTGLEYLLAGEAILFIGAGFSTGAKNLRNSPLKTGGGLAKYLSAEVKLPEGTSLEDASEEFALKRGDAALITELQQEFTAREVSAAQVEILRQPWKRVYTTNYDNVAEMSAARSGKRLTPVTLSDDRREVPTTGTLSVHLNGYIDRLTQSNLWSEIKLTDTSYLTASIAQSPWSVLLRQDVEAARVVFFVGYSTADLDIRRILFESDTLREKCFFVLGTPDASTIRRVSRFGVLANMDATALAEALRNKSLTYVPPDSAPPFEHCFRKYIIEGPSEPFTDRYIFDFLLFGSVKPRLVWQSFHDNLRYLIARRAVDLAISRIESGSKAVVIHSDLGNGKTGTVEGLKVKAADRCFDVYSLSVRGESLYEELEWICQSNRRTIIVVETYPDWFDVIDYIGVNAPKTLSLVLTARTSTHDVTFDRLPDKLATDKIIEISVDRLMADECEGIVDLFDEYGLWGDLASKSRRAKLEHLNFKCHAQWHAILINRFQSPQIQERFAPIVESLSKKKHNYEIIIAILLLTVLDYLPSLDVLIAVCGSGIWEQSFRRDPSVTELVDTAGGRVVLRSSVAGQFILKQVADPNVVVGVLTKITKAADAQAGASTFYFALLKALTRFSNLQDILPEKERRKAVIRFYESIKGLQSTKKNPLFWLQYAIACLVFEDFERAEKYFATAYSFAEARDVYDSYQIDNHYARFLLMRAIRSGDPSSCMAPFREARKLLYEEIQNDRLHYPFRVAKLIGEFYDAFASALPNSDKGEIGRAAKFILDRIAKLPLERQNHRSVTECAEAMQHVLSLVDPALLEKAAKK